MINKNKIEVISFKDFMSPPAPSIQMKFPLTTSIYGFIPPITLKGLFPLHEPAFVLFLIGGGLIAATAFSEKILTVNGFTNITGVVSRVTKIMFPVLGYGALFWLIFFGMRG